MSDNERAFDLTPSVSMPYPERAKDFARIPCTRTKEQLEQAAKDAYERARTDEQAPEGFYTLSEWTSILGKSMTTIRDQFKGMERNGKLDKMKLERQGKLRNFYRIIDPEV